MLGLGIVEEVVPRAATDLLLRAGARPQVFHEMEDGSYLTWAAAGRLPVFVDPRLEVYGEELMGRYFALSGRRWPDVAAWNAFAAAQGIQTALLMHDYDDNLMRLLLESPDWRLAHVDHRNVVFVRDTAEHAALIREHEVPLDRPWIRPGAIPDELPPAWRRRLGAVGRPWFTFGIAKAFLRLGSPVNATPYLEEGLRRFPTHVEMRWTLAQVYRSGGRDADADRLTRGLRLSAEARASADRLLATLLRQQGRHAEAAEALRRSLDSRPDPRALDDLARATFASGDPAGAADLFLQLVQARPGDVEAWANLGRASEVAHRTPQAIAAYGRALELDPTRHQVHNQLGILLAVQGRHEEARRHFERALELKPDYAAARANLARLPRR
jgi:tetratricopeptide (TPR) repeat protein